MKSKKILVIVLTLLVSLFTVIPMGTAQLRVDASEAYQEVNSSSGIVTTADVKLRTGPAKTFDIISKLKKDQKVTVIGKLGDWYAVYISTSGNVGAVYAPYIKLEKAKAPATSNKQISATTIKSPSTSPSKVVEEKTSTKPVTIVTPIIKDISIDEQALLDLVNKARKEKGLKALEFDAGLVKIARLKAADMKNNNYFSHTSKFYGTPFDMMKKYEIKFSAAGENIAGNRTLDKVLKAWVNESGNNIFSEKFTHTGIGIVYSPTYGKLIVQMFIKKT